ncbi:unnamed protein product [Soboliphyme baturini]|uniref:Miro domain-containing protein n=1 Tax=Soboliphyme baturini TaxID=241478 RepID=A0A183J5W7_9BILA|nr:unnamed protein product [Soboliphyme baturini]
MTTWPELEAITAPTSVEQRFLSLPESADFERVRSFSIDRRGKLVERGYCYVHRDSDASSSSGLGTSAGHRSYRSDSATSQVDSLTDDTNYAKLCHKTVFIIGQENVGKSSLLEAFQKYASLSNEDYIEIDEDVLTMLLVDGKEIYLHFVEKSTKFSCATFELKALSLECNLLLADKCVSDLQASGKLILNHTFGNSIESFAPKERPLGFRIGGHQWGLF